MEKDKYYTPDISEIGHGMEDQANYNKQGQATHDYSWYHLGKNDLTGKLNCIKELIEFPISRENPDEVQEKLIKLTAISALSAETVSEANRELKEKQVEIIIMFGKSDLPASILKIFIDGKCANEFAMFTFADRLNAAITHSIDGLRSIISLHNTEIKNSLK